jgi:hypothetical protein
MPNSMRKGWLGISESPSHASGANKIKVSFKDRAVPLAALKTTPSYAGPHKPDKHSAIVFQFAPGLSRKALSLGNSPAKA